MSVQWQLVFRLEITRDSASCPPTCFRWTSRIDQTKPVGHLFRELFRKQGHRCPKPSEEPHFCPQTLDPATPRYHRSTACRHNRRSGSATLRHERTADAPEWTWHPVSSEFCRVLPAAA